MLSVNRLSFEEARILLDGAALKARQMKSQVLVPADLNRNDSVQTQNKKKKKKT